MAKDDVIEKFWDRVSPEPNSGCWLWTGGLYQSGYAKFFLRKMGSVKECALGHRWAYEYFIEPIPNNLCICHKCDVRSCVNPDHVDMAKKGRHWKAKLTAEDVLKIKSSNDQGIDLAQQFNVSPAVISAVRCNRVYKWVSEC